MRRLTIVTTLVLLAALPVIISGTFKDRGPASSTASPCVECQTQVTPGIVTDWAVSKPSGMGVDCSVCHGGEHTTADDAGEAAIPTPQTCSVCHAERVEQFSAGKHALAWAAMKAMPTTHMAPMALIEGMKGCGGCHKIGLKTEQEIEALKQTGAGFGAHFLGAGSAAAAGLPDLSHGVRSSAVGDVLRLQARRALPAQAERDASRRGSGPDLPDLSHAGRRS